jgi:quinol monooxygenase YgiN
VKPNALQGPAPKARTAAASTASDATTRSAGSVAVLVLADMRPTARLWAWGRLVLGARPYAGVPGLRFVKVLGSGEGGGFGLKPSGTHRGLFLGFDDEATARDFIENSAQLAAWRAHARECLVALLRASSSKGSWSGAAMAVTATAPGLHDNAPIAAITRASIRPRHARAFWRLSPPAEASLAAADGCLLAAGLGEAPLLRQCTFSLWRNTAAMDAYARSGAHQQAIRAAYGGGYFSESMFVRFVPLSLEGSWQGRHHG